MGLCCSVPQADLPAASEDDLAKLRERGHLPHLAGPSSDFDGENYCKTVYFAAYEHGTELTLLFLDEDRPNAVEDCVYDSIRRPLFGRKSDIETLFFVDGKAEFPGTYSGDQDWSEKCPRHNEAAVDLSAFERKDGCPVVWINTWNHLLGDRNTNGDKAITHQAARTLEGLDYKDFVVRRGSRSEVDARFKGCITSISEVLTEERAQRLGKRLF